MKTKAVFYTSRGAGHRGRLISGRFSRGFLGLSLSAIFAVLATIPAFATDPDPELIAAQKTVASKAYVDTKQNKIPAGTAGNVVTYTGTAGSVGSVATANAPTYNSTTGALENGTSIATIAAVDTRQKKMTCAGYETGHENDADYCWLWTISDD